MSHRTDPDEDDATRRSPGRDRSSTGGAQVGRAGPALRHRVAAAGALVCLAASATGVVVGTIRGLPEVVVPVALGAASVWLGWRALTRRGHRRWAYTALAVPSAVAAIATAVWIGGQFPVLVASLAAAVLAAVLAGGALAWVHQPGGRLVKRARHPVLVVNPRSGDGVAVDSGLVDEARRRGIRVHELGEGDDLAVLARRAIRHGADALGMAGGDGSLGLVASIAMRADVPFVCVPAGTRNHFALDLGLDRNDPVAALDGFGEAVQRRVDVARVGEQVFLNNVSMGAYGHVVSSDGYRENKVGVALAAVPELVGPDAELLDLCFVDGDGVEHTSAVVVHVSNNPYELAPSAGFGSRPSLVGGTLGIAAVVADGAEGPPLLLQWQATEFEVRSGAPVPAGVDGEFVELDPPVRLRVQPRALKVRMPRDVAGVSPAARRPSLTSRTLRRLVAVAGGEVPPDELPGS